MVKKVKKNEFKDRRPTGRPREKMVGPNPEGYEGDGAELGGC